MIRQMAVVAIAEESQLPALVGTISRTFTKRLKKESENPAKAAAATEAIEQNVIISTNTWATLKSSKSQSVNPFVPLASLPTTDASVGLPPASVLPDGGFDLCQFATQLRTVKFGRSIVYVPSIDSTQDFLHEMIEDERLRALSGDGDAKRGVVEGLVCVADIQTKGKGRGKNVWTSPMGCLMFSFLSKYTDGKQMPMVQYLLSVAMARGVRTATKSDATPNPSIRIKWPNDFYSSVPVTAVTADDDTGSTVPPAVPASAGAKAPGLYKVGGILCNSSYQQTRGVGTFSLVAGIGLNVDNSKPTMALKHVMKLNGQTREGGAPQLTRAWLLAMFFNNFEPMHAKFRQSGFAPFLSEYLAQWLHTGQEVVFEDQTSAAKTQLTAVIQGLAASGCLLARLKDTAELVELMPDTGRLDMMQGLLLRSRAPRI